MKKILLFFFPFLGENFFNDIQLEKRVFIRRTSYTEENTREKIIVQDFIYSVDEFHKKLHYAVSLFAMNLNSSKNIILSPEDRDELVKLIEKTFITK